MSLKHLNKLLAASLILVLVLTSQAAAVQGFRPWAPYQQDEFGGEQRRAEGVYGTLEAVYYTFSPVKNICIGEVDSTGGVRKAFTGYAMLDQTNTINTNHLGSVSGVGTRIEVGHMRKHFGWSISGYNINGASSSVSMPNASIVINDKQDPSAFSINVPLNNIELIYYWDENNSNFVPASAMETSIGGDRMPSGSLWGWFLSRYSDTNYVDGTAASADILAGYLAPLPINFETAKVTSKMEHWTVEALCTYRMHPTKFGNFDFFGGVRYMEIDDSLNFLGEGSPWKGIQLVADDDTTGTGTGTGSSTTDTYVNPLVENLAETTYHLEGMAFGVGSVLGDSDWKFKAENHIIAPQVGMRYSRSNKRWTLTAEGKFLAGLNNQNLRSKGTFGSYYDYLSIVEDPSEIFPEDLLPETVRDLGVYPWTPTGALYGRRSFNHSGVRHAFSPGAEGKINANWQITNAVGVQFGVTVMWVDRIARGSKLNDFTIHPNGQFFGLRAGRKTESDALMYGFNIGMTVNRF